MKDEIIFVFTCVDQNQIDVTNTTIDEFINKHDNELSDVEIIVNTHHVLAIRAKESDKEFIRAIALTVSKYSPIQNILIYEEQTKTEIDPSIDRIETLGWWLQNGKVVNKRAN